MERFVRGDVVVIPFPFSDLSDSKRRPALVLADLPDDDILLCEITSQQSNTKFIVPLTARDFISGALPVDSFIRPARIFTADKNLIVRKVGVVNTSILSTAVDMIVDLISG